MSERSEWSVQRGGKGLGIRGKHNEMDMIFIAKIAFTIHNLIL